MTSNTVTFDKTWAALRYMVRFNLEQYSSRVHVLNPSSIPSASIVCAPAVCTPEMVGRFVFPEFHIDGFDVRNMAGWPILGTEVSVGEADFWEIGGLNSAAVRIESDFTI